MKATDETYKKSNAIESVEYSRFSHKEYNNVLSCGEDVAERQMAAQCLIKYLCDKYKLPPCKVVVRSSAQPTFRNGSGKTLGKYTTWGIGKRLIEIWNLTAKQKKVVSIKVFMGTLLHEFMHHYDLEYLKLGATIHSTGFYKRITDLDNKLKE